MKGNIKCGRGGENLAQKVWGVFINDVEYHPDLYRNSIKSIVVMWRDYIACMPIGRDKDVKVKTIETGGKQ